MIERIITVTRKTELEELVERFGTVPQVKFYLEHAGHDFARIQAAHDTYMFALAEIRKLVPREFKHHTIGREFVPRYSFDRDDLIVTVGQDGLVSNTAKYLNGQPLLAVNPDPDLYDGILMAVTPDTAGPTFKAALAGSGRLKPVSMAEAKTSDGQSLLAFNDLFIGANSHISARYRISHGEASEVQSSSGIIVSTGAGSTGWMRSVHTGALGVMAAVSSTSVPLNSPAPLDWSSPSLLFAVREPFPSHATKTSLIYGQVSADTPLRVVSRMAGYGIIFSDGIQSDYVTFNSGTDVTIALAAKTAQLVDAA